MKTTALPTRSDSLLLLGRLDGRLHGNAFADVFLARARLNGAVSIAELAGVPIKVRDLLQWITCRSAPPRAAEGLNDPISTAAVFHFAIRADEDNPELLYAATMFHDIGLMPPYSSPDLRFEVDGANAARDFLRGHNVNPADIEKVWTGIALHTTPGVPEFMHPVIALTTAGVEMDVLGLTYDQYDDVTREALVAAFPRTPAFKEDIIQAFYDGIRHKPETTFGNVKADVIADKEPHFNRGNFCSVIRGSHWHG